MSSILKKSSRRDQRIPVRGSCVAHSINSTKQYVLRLLDLSHGGLSFILKEPAFVERTALEIHFSNLGRRSFTLRAMVVSTPEPLETKGPTVFRYSVRFERRLSEEQYKLLLQSFDLQVSSLLG